MEKIKRAERMVAITQMLMLKPNVLTPLTLFAERFGTAKSTISEDLIVVKESLLLSGHGHLETIAGVGGGVRYIPDISMEEATQFLKKLAERLSDKERILTGGFLYMTDLLSDPAILGQVGLIFARVFRRQKPDVVVTIETKGIPLALVTAEALGLPMVVIRRGNKVTEGSSVSINYVSGSFRRIQTMSLARRALEPKQRVLVIDDFMKAGGTALGIKNLMTEFEANVVGLGVLVEAQLTEEPKLVDGFLSLLKLKKLNVNTGKINILPVLPSEFNFKDGEDGKNP